MPYETIDIPLAAGLNTKADSKAMQPPGLAVAKDIQFDDIGGIQTRPQYQAIADAAGNTIADIRKVAVYGDELVAFSKDKLWSYASGDGLWTERADYLAVKTDEFARFVSTGEQYDCDRAELGGVIMYCWTEDTQSGTTSYVAAIDKATGAVKMGRTALDAAQVRPRLLAGSTRLYLLCYEGAGADTLVCRAYDPSDLSVLSSAASVVGLDGYDAIINPVDTTEVLAVASLGTTYAIISFQEAATAATEQTRTVTTDGAIAIAYNDAATDEIAIVYTDTGQIKADFYSAAYVSVANDIAVGAGVGVTTNQIAAIYQTSDSKLRVFWSNSESTGFSSAFTTETNTCTNAGADTESTFAMRCGVASRAFLHDGRVYVWITFAGISTGAITAQLQNSYFLYRDDRTIVAKAVATNGGGFVTTTAHLPNVQSLGSNQWAWCAVLRRIVPLGQDQKGYAARSPQDVVFEFDSDEARRTAQLGDTLYIAGGNLSQYDGSSLVEVGFHIFPWHLQVAVGAAGNLTGTYNYLQTYNWYNAKGEVERSTTASIATSSAMTADKGTATGVNLHVTAKTGDAGEVSIEYWRQVADAAFGAPFYLISSKDPASTGDNKYMENDMDDGTATSLTDNVSDADLISKETFPENGGLVLENLSPPSASIIIATQDRLILAGIPGHPNRFAYSKLRGDGEVASFHDSLYGDLPPAGGDITAIAFQSETMIMFKQTAIYAVPGDGYDNNGGGQNYGPARILNSDVGAESMEAVALTPKGLLFKSSKGWYLLNGWSADYVGGAVAEFDALAVKSISVMESQHQVRCAVTGKTLVWDYLADEWSEWTVATVDALVWDGDHSCVNTAVDGLIAQASTHSGAGDLPQLDIETGWIKLAGLQGYGLARRLLVLGENRGAHDLRIRAAYDYVEKDSAGPETLITGGEIVTGLIVKAGSNYIDVVSTAGYTATGTITVLDPAFGATEDIEYTSITATRFTLATPTTIDLRPTGVGDSTVNDAILAGPTWIDDKTWTVSPTTVGGPLQVEHGLSRPKCQSVKFRITAQAVGTTAAPVTKALNLSGLSLEMKIKNSNFGRAMGASQKQ